MLSKLFKYDMKSLSRFLVIIHAFLLLFAVGMRFFVTQRIDSVVDSESGSFLLTLTYILYIITIMGASFATYIIIAVRFYKNLYSDEGYLSYTLPVTGGQHLLSKVMAGSIWSFIDVTFIILSILIAVFTPILTSSFQENKAEFLSVLGFDKDHSPLTFVCMLLFLFVISCTVGVISIYASVTIGQLFTGHRILGAVISYFAISTVMSVLSFVIMGFTGFFSKYGMITSTPQSFNFAGYMTYLCEICLVPTVITGVILYLVTLWLMKKMVNLQ